MSECIEEVQVPSGSEPELSDPFSTKGTAGLNGRRLKSTGKAKKKCKHRKSGDKPGDKSGDKSDDKPTSKSDDKPTSKSDDKPTSKSNGKSGGKPNAKNKGKPKWKQAPGLFSGSSQRFHSRGAKSRGPRSQGSRGRESFQRSQSSGSKTTRHSFKVLVIVNQDGNTIVKIEGLCIHCGCHTKDGTKASCDEVQAEKTFTFTKPRLHGRPERDDVWKFSKPHPYHKRRGNDYALNANWYEPLVAVILGRGKLEEGSPFEEILAIFVNAVKGDTEIGRKFTKVCNEVKAVADKAAALSAAALSADKAAEIDQAVEKALDDRKKGIRIGAKPFVSSKSKPS